MVFSSPIFLLGFLPLFLGLYALVFAPTRWLSEGPSRRFFFAFSNGFILAASLLFYFWGENWLIVVMLASTTIDYVSGQVIGRSGRPRLRKGFLVVSIVANLSLLVFFKYANFGIEAFTGLASALGWGQGPVAEMWNISLPLGISFYTFQSMSYTIDVYRRKVKPTRSFLDFACYVTMFPQLVAGPIVRYREVADELRQRIVSLNDFSYGCLRFTQGLAKKVLISNAAAVPTDAIFAMGADELSTGLAWLGLLGYSIQIYFDFSGYSDMAIGLGRMLGFHFPENFNYPYIAGSIAEFWRRWHISLSNWFRDYLYFPLGGDRNGPRRVYFNLVTVFFLVGLWHGAAYGYVIFGLYHGLFLVLERRGLGARLKRLPRLVQILYMQLVLNLSWIIFRPTDLGQTKYYAKSVFGMADTQNDVLSVAEFLTPESATALLLGAVFACPLLPWLLRVKDRLLLRWSHPIWKVAYGGTKLGVMFAALVLSVATLASGSYNPFIYFRF
ncbi:MAG: alginate O-acetyltransferase complex protein AlgI [Candidatus Krumholzibacteriia bacterium]|jgi:alginate O-acetyltransferase complex protein AlgI